MKHLVNKTQAGLLLQESAIDWCVVCFVDVRIYLNADTFKPSFLEKHVLSVCMFLHARNPSHKAHTFAL
jgi:hypothetical protein